MVKKSDFVLAPYMKSNDLQATWQIINTLVPYTILWGIAAHVTSISPWLLLPTIILMVLFSLRSFSLMHDCGHYSLFTSKRMNRLIGFVLGVINAVPQYTWSRDHAYHHKTNGDWERYRGIGDFLSTTEFAQLNAFEQKLYGILRHPMILLPGGFFYLVIKPRMTLILGIFEFILHWCRCFWSREKMDAPSIISSYQSKHWQTRGEFWDLLLNNIFVIGSWLILSRFIGLKLFISICPLVLTLAGAIFIAVFFVQHNFAEAYAHKTENWDFVRGAIEGSSYLELPVLLRWFTADIGYHNIHHLSERIPNYHLAACHQQNRHLLSHVKVIHISEMLSCAPYILWDADTNTLATMPTKYQVSLMSEERVRSAIDLPGGGTMPSYALKTGSEVTSNATSDTKTHQLEQYLHRPGRIPTAAHPFVKQAAGQADRSHPQRCPPLGLQIARWGGLSRP